MVLVSCRYLSIEFLAFALCVVVKLRECGIETSLKTSHSRTVKQVSDHCQILLIDSGVDEM